MKWIMWYLSFINLCTQWNSITWWKNNRWKAVGWCETEKERREKDREVTLSSAQSFILGANIWSSYLFLLYRTHKYVQLSSTPEGRKTRWSRHCKVACAFCGRLETCLQKNVSWALASHSKPEGKSTRTVSLNPPPHKEIEEHAFNETVNSH